MPAPSIELGIGDDAAVLAQSDAKQVVSVDASFENVHFTLQHGALDLLAERAFVAALSDLAAMGATPRAALVSLAVPSAFSDDSFEAVTQGIARAAQHYACPVIGGNLSSASEISITTTVIGEVIGTVLQRAGARIGDGIYVTGILGAASLGCALLEAHAQHAHDPRAEPFIARWQKPTARIREGLLLRGLASAAIDVSDGLVQDLEHLCSASGVGATIETTSLPAARGFSELAHALGRDPLQLALAGGEDYELLYTLPQLAAAPDFGTRIGTITAHVGEVHLLDAGGRTLDLSVRGYDHFS